MITIPKTTFFNLPDEKRDRIIKAAIDEFANQPYDQASIANIIEKAGIPRGSFYQYFEDKKDLYKYIINTIVEKKIEMINSTLGRAGNDDFFMLLRTVYEAGLQFAMKYPKFAKIGELFLKYPNNELKEEILGEQTGRSTDFFKQWLKQGVERGELYPDLDVDLTSALLFSMNQAIGEYFINKLEFSQHDEIMEIVDKMMYFIENGLRNKTSRGA